MSYLRKNCDPAEQAACSTLGDTDLDFVALTADSVGGLDLPAKQAPPTAAPIHLTGAKATGIDLLPKFLQRDDRLHEREVQIHSARQSAPVAFARISSIPPAK
jgi:hypothetical protein